MRIDHSGLQSDSLSPLTFGLSEVFGARVSESELEMADGIIRRAFYGLFKNVNSVGLFLLTIQDRALQNHGGGIRWEIFQNGVVHFGCLIQAILLQQELNVSFGNRLIFGKVGIKRTELTGCLLEFSLA